MTIKATCFHAGCPVCVSAEQSLAALLDPTRVAVESVHLGEDRQHLSEAEQAGVRSVPALVSTARCSTSTTAPTSRL
jgi:hypothetical protein